MKKFITVIFFAFISLVAFAQSGFDKSIAEISSNLADKLSQKGKKKIVVLYVTDINKAPTVAGKYIADGISYNIVNNPGDFQVFDRENLSSIAEAKSLIAEGYIDIDKTKELGKLLSVEAIIIGNYTVLSNKIKLTIKALDVNTGFIIAASMKNLLLDGDAGALLGINVSSSSGTNINKSNRGFNRPLSSNEQYNNPGTVSKECETNNTGDYCFENKSKAKVRLHVAYNGDMILEIGQTQCLYNVKCRNYVYRIYKLPQRSNDPIGQGQILVEQCKSKTFTIR